MEWDPIALLANSQRSVLLSTDTAGRKKGLRRSKTACEGLSSRKPWSLGSRQAP